MRIKLCKTIVFPECVIVGSKSVEGTVHRVIRETVFNDTICDCKGYIFRGRCSHIDQVEESRHNWWTDNLDYEGICPICGSEVIEFELDPEVIGLNA